MLGPTPSRSWWPEWIGPHVGAPGRASAIDALEMPKRGRGKPVPWKNGSERAVSWTRPRGQSLALLFLVVVAAFALGATMGPGLARAASDPAGLFTSARRSIRRGVVGGVLRAAGSFGSLGSGTRVKLFIASYKEDALLEELLESVIASDVMLFDTQVHVINNNPVPLRQRVGFKVPKLVAVHDRALTEPGGLGFPSRTWNQALMSGFRSLDQPDADIVVVLHADTQLGTDWFQVVATHLANCSLATYGAGDQIVVYTPEALRRIGLWDERFSSMSHHEADYFLRARLYAADASCIHDFSHGRVHRRQDGVFRYSR